jgi:hypothetical protein
MVIALHGLHPWLSNATATQFKPTQISRTALALSLHISLKDTFQ